MNVSAVSGSLAVGSTALSNAAAKAAASAFGGNESESFTTTLHNALSSVDKTQTEASDKVSALLNGSGEDVHDAMISVEKASLSFNLMMQVRNKVVGAYQEIQKLQF